MRPNDQVIAVLCSDLHLSHKPPIARSDEPDWYTTMAVQLEQLRKVSIVNGSAPIICAGDIFDKWNSPAELINFAIKHLPKMFAIPGQHDLPHHNYSDIHKSAYWTLVQAGVIENLEPGRCRIVIPHMVMYGFPFGHPLESLIGRPEKKDLVHLAVVHKYCWMGHNKYPDAEKKSNIRTHKKQLKGFDAALFGDNHKGFLATSADGFNLLNCGGFMRRRSDEAGYAPKIGLLHRNGSITTHLMNVESDVISTLADQETNDSGIGNFIGDLNKMYDLGLDFEQAVTHFLHGHTLDKEVVKLIHKALKL